MYFSIKKRRFNTRSIYTRREDGKPEGYLDTSEVPKGKKEITKKFEFLILIFGFYCYLFIFFY